MEREMNGINECGFGFGCGCEPPRPSCLDDIACSQRKVAECEAKLFCVIADRLGCEIRHARCMRELEYLLRLTNNFLAASAVKEKAIGEVVSALCDCDD
ncbi:MAG TPA: hypothetical protein PK438_05120 [Clostridia bacterium]|nr:hypothetical protein [Clostridia bacterium]HOS18649.1 hypothetical protein [Clostridia bacterium]HPK16019.1 hypothetical protein [Clostridia bacterium]